MGPTPKKVRQCVRRRRNLEDLMGHRSVDRKNPAPIVLCPHTSTRSTNPFHLDGFFPTSYIFLAAGYMCSLRPLKLMSSKNDPVTYRSFSTSLFRTVLCLYLPAAAVTLIPTLATSGGLYGPMKAYMTDVKKKQLYFSGPIGRAHR